MAVTTKLSAIFLSGLGLAAAHSIIGMEAKGKVLREIFAGEDPKAIAHMTKKVNTDRCGDLHGEQAFACNDARDALAQLAEGDVLTATWKRFKFILQ